MSRKPIFNASDYKVNKSDRDDSGRKSEPLVSYQQQFGPRSSRPSLHEDYQHKYQDREQKQYLEQKLKLDTYQDLLKAVREVMIQEKMLDQKSNPLELNQMKKDVELLKIEIKNIKRNDIQKDLQQKVFDLQQEVSNNKFNMKQDIEKVVKQENQRNYDNTFNKQIQDQIEQVKLSLQEKLNNDNEINIKLNEMNKDLNRQINLLKNKDIEQIKEEFKEFKKKLENGMIREEQEVLVEEYDEQQEQENNIEAKEQKMKKNIQLKELKQNLEGMDIVSYLLDDYGYLMDENSNYILDENGDLIQLNDKQIQYLKLAQTN